MKRKPAKELKGLSAPSDQIMLVAEEISFSNQESDPHYLEIISLRHPRDNRNAKFIYNLKENTVYEMLKFSQPHRSWFIGNSISSDGSLYLSTKVDPLFLVLPYLHEAKMSSTFDQLIHDDNYADSMKLEAFVDDEQLTFIADKKDLDGLVVWKYNDEKTLSWLSKKAKRVAKLLEERNMNVNTSCAVSNTYIKTEKDTPENYLRYAHGMISDYLQPALSDKLSMYLKLPLLETTNTKKRKSAGLDVDDIKKIKIECREQEIAEAEMKSGSKVEKAKKNAKQAALAKAATGSKSISSFFKKK